MSKLETNTIDNISGSTTLTIGDSNTSTIALKSGATLTNFPDNTPAFEAVLSSSTNPTNNTETKIAFDSEVFDTDNCYDNTTNYRFTPTVAGKYYVYSNIMLQEEGATASQVRTVSARIYKNGTGVKSVRSDFNANDVKQFSVYVDGIIDMNGTTDYLEIYGYVNTISGDNWEYTGPNDGQRTYFGAYKLPGV